MNILIIYITTILVSMGVNVFAIKKALKDIDKHNLTINNSFYDKEKLDEMLKKMSIKNYQEAKLYIPLLNIVSSINNTKTYIKNNDELINELTSIGFLREKTEEDTENPEDIKKDINSVKKVISLYQSLERYTVVNLKDGKFYYCLNPETFRPILLKTSGVYQTLSNELQQEIFEEIIDMISKNIIGEIENNNQDNYKMSASIGNGNINIDKYLNDFMVKKQIENDLGIKNNEKHFQAPVIEIKHRSNRPKTKIRELK